MKADPLNVQVCNYMHDKGLMTCILNATTDYSGDRLLSGVLSLEIKINGTLDPTLTAEGHFPRPSNNQHSGEVY